MANADARAKNIRLVCFDVDGTLTDGHLHFDENGGETKSFHVHDGQGLRLLEDCGIRVALITARHSRIVQARGRDLRLQHVFDGVSDKLAVVRQLCVAEGITLAEVAYMGDDYPDLACLQTVGLPACPADALPPIQASVLWTSQFSGGHGAAREFCDFILSIQGKDEALLHRFSNHELP
jgi:3-deoxy-D-manno-octulosonate 8-phosphate phosphatase (KDO 8-P phosphatase)